MPGMAPARDEDEDLSTTVQLVRAAKKGEQAAIEDLFKRYLVPVRQMVALRMGGRLWQFLYLEDLVQ